MIKDLAQRKYAASAKGRAQRKNFEKVHGFRRRLRARYGITPQQYDAMLLAQGGACATCRRVVKKFHVDHCHLTGIVRGILCPSCNRALGMINENSGTARALAEYLERSR